MLLIILRCLVNIMTTGCEEEITSVTPLTEVYETTTVQEDCANTTYGCCPNGISTATGTNFAGCGVINAENCTISYFGCCPDGASPGMLHNYIKISKYTFSKISVVL